MRKSIRKRLSKCGFTVLEILVAAAVLALLMVLILNITGTTARMWQNTTAKMDAFEEARSALDRITAILRQAELNIYWGYDNTDKPQKYERSSELQFLSLPMNRLGVDAASHPTHGIFFQAPTGKVADKATYGGLRSVLNAYGFFIEYGDDSNERPSFLPAAMQSHRYRFRLKEWRVPSDEWTLYKHTSGKDEEGKARRTGYLGPASYGWLDFTKPEPRNLAENVIALIISPRRSLVAGSTTALLTNDYLYNSRNADAASDQFHQLPPIVEIVLVAVDEDSLQRSVGNPSTPPELVAPGLFVTPDWLDEDLETLGESLTARGIRYVVLRSTVRIAGAKGKI